MVPGNARNAITVLLAVLYEFTGIAASVELYIPKPCKAINRQIYTGEETIEDPWATGCPATPPTRNPFVIILHVRIIET